MVHYSPSAGRKHYGPGTPRAGTPVIASRIAGNIGLLGLDYAGYYALEDERALARLLTRAETEPNFYALLKKQCAARRKLVTPKAELRGLRKLLLG